MGRSSQRSSFAEIVLKKWTAPREAPRQAMIGGVEGSLRAFDLHVHLAALETRVEAGQQNYRNGHQRPARLRHGAARATHGFDGGRPHGCVDGSRNATEMVCVLDDFDVLLLDQYAATLVEVLKARKDFTNVEQLAKEGASDISSGEAASS